MKKRSGILYIALAILVLAIVATLAYYINQAPPSHEDNSTNNTIRPLKALIYDSLAREYPNKTLIHNIVALLRSHGYEVDVYIGANATLDPLYRLGDYGLVILRAHGGFNGQITSMKPLGSYVFTGIHDSEAVELYGRSRYEKMLSENLIALGVIPPPGITVRSEEGIKRLDLPRYVIVSPKFFNLEIKKLSHTIIIYTGCYGFDNDILARIFIDKGASAYIAFKGNVTWSHGDLVLDKLLRMYIDKQDIKEAFREVSETIGGDPYTGAELKALFR